MRKSILYSIALVAMMSVACHKAEQAEQKQVNRGPVFTAGIAAVKTSLTIEDKVGKVEWVAGDMITVTDGVGTSALYVAESDGAVTTFVPAEGQPVLGAGPYSAKYGGEEHNGVILKKQNYADTDDLPYLTMSAESDDTNFTFNVSCGVLSLRLVGEGITVKTIMLKGPSTDLYTLNCGDGIGITSGKTFRMCFNPGLYKKIYLTDTNDKTSIFTLADDYELELTGNEVIPASITDIVASQFDCIYLGSRVNGESNNYPVCWAECNIGAEHCYDAGYYFQWGQTDGYKYVAGKWHLNGETSNPEFKFSTATTATEITINNDAARVHWGGNWRMPVDNEFSKLIKYSSNTPPFTYYENYQGTGVKGVEIIGNTGAKLFLPEVGLAKDNKNTLSAGVAYYWINNGMKDGKPFGIQIGPNVMDSKKTKTLYYKTYDATASYGFPIRPVKD